MRLAVLGWALAAPLLARDTTPPTPPARLFATALSGYEVYLNWAASSDDVGVAGYRIYRNGAPIGSTSSLSYYDRTTAVATAYTYAVAAYDAEGNVSALSAQPVVTTRDHFGGDPTQPCAGGGGKHNAYTEKQADGRWFLCTPDGNRIFFEAVWNPIVASNGTDPHNGYTAANALANKHYGTNDTAWDLNHRMLSWGFNAQGPGAYHHSYATYTGGGGIPAPLKMLNLGGVNKASPTPNCLAWTYSTGANATGHSFAVKDLWRMIDTGRFAYWRTFADVFDPNWNQCVSERYSYAFIDEVGNSNDIPLVKSQWMVALQAEDTDNVIGFGGGLEWQSDPVGKGHWHPGAGALITSPVMQWNFAGRKHYTDTANYSKQRLQAMMQAKYGTIEALNAAWGSAYTTWNSSGTGHSAEAVATGNGTAGPYSFTLAAAPVSKNTLRISVGGVLAAVDGGDGKLYWDGDSTATRGTVDYSTGAVSVTFQTLAGSGAVIRAEYADGGWAAGGTGWLDDAGQNSAWYGNNPVLLSDDMRRHPYGYPNPTAAQAALVADLNNMLTAQADAYQTAMHGGVQSVNNWLNNSGACLPGPCKILDFGASNIGAAGWRNPGWCAVIRGVSRTADFIVTGFAGGETLADGGDAQSHLDWMAGCMDRDIPMLIWEGVTSQADSTWSAYVNNVGASGAAAGWDEANQAMRGALYRADINSLLHTRTSAPAAHVAAGTSPFIGFVFWRWRDDPGQMTNWGLTSILDNAYDATEAVGSPAQDQPCSSPDYWYNASVYSCGHEAATYGNFIDAVRAANFAWAAGPVAVPRTSGPIRLNGRIR